MKANIFRSVMVIFTLAGMALFMDWVANVPHISMGQAMRSAQTDSILIYLPMVRKDGPTTVCGDITTDTVWKVNGSPYQVTCDVRVTSGVTLTINAGVTVQFGGIEDDLIISGTLQAVGIPDATILFQPASGASPGSWGRVAFMPGSSGILEHTLLEFGGSYEGMVFIASDDVQLVESVVQYSAGGGIVIRGASPLISATLIMSNTPSIDYYGGGGLYNDFGSPIIQNTTFRNNSVTCNNCGGGGLYNGSGNPTIQNNIFSNNSAKGKGGGLFTGGSPIIQNNTFSGNTAVGWCDYKYCTNSEGGGIYIDYGRPIIRSNIIVNNQADDWGGISGSSYQISVLDYNDVWNNAGGDYGTVTHGAHDISADPLFFDAAHGDFHLAPGSLCIDAGDPYHYPATDFEGEPRPMGRAPDIGVDEVLSLRVKKSSVPDEASPGEAITYSVTVANPLPFPLQDVHLSDNLPAETALTGYQADGLTCTHDGSAWGGLLSCTLEGVDLSPGESQALTVTVKITDTLPVYINITNPVTATASYNGKTYLAHDQTLTWVSFCAVQLNDTPMGRNLQGAIDASLQPTDVVKVSGYCRVHDLRLNKTMILQGGWSRDFSTWDPGVYTTTLDGQGLGRVMELTGDVNPTIEGFTITGGTSGQGGGLYNGSGSPIIQNNIFTNNQADYYGGGLESGLGSPIIRNNTFSDNQAKFGGGLSNDSGNPIIQNNTFTGNTGSGLNNNGNGIIQNNTFASNTGSGLITNGSPIIQNNTFISNSWGLFNTGGSPIIQNNTFTNNQAGNGGGISNLFGNPIIRNNIIVNNTASEAGGGIYNNSGNPIIRNNIIVSNTGRGIYNDSTAGRILTLDYNDVWNNAGGNYSGVTPGAHDIAADPLFLDDVHGDFHLASGSPCIDAGDPDHYPETDFEGDPRPMGGAPDIGADEFRTLRLEKSAVPDEASPGETVTYTVTVANPLLFPVQDVLLTDNLPTETALTVYEEDGLTCTHDGSAWGGLLSCTLDGLTLAPGESRTLRVTVKITDTLPTDPNVINPVIATASYSGETYIAHDQAVIWVSSCAVQFNNTPMGRDLQAAVDASLQPTDIVKVSGYCHVHDLSLDKTLTLQGGWSRDFSQWNLGVYTTTLDGQGLGRVMEAVGDANPIIEGFTITGGTSGQGGGLYIDLGSPIIQNNTFTTNTGSGLFNSSGSPIIQNNTFINNKANLGGALHNDSGSPMIQNNTLTNNQTNYKGGGLANLRGNPTIQNNTFANNQAIVGGGLYNGSGSPIIRDNTFTNNQAGVGGGLYNDSGSPMIQNNKFTNNRTNTDGGGLVNIRGNPAIQNNTFTNNQADYSGGGLHNDSGSPIIRNNTFTNNQAGGGGGLSNISGNPDIQNNTFISNTGSGLCNVSGNPIILNNTFTNNQAGFGGGLCNNSGNPIILNNTFTNNQADWGGGLYNYIGNPTIRNNIIVNNTASLGGGGIFDHFDGGSPALDYNDVWNNTGGDYSGVAPGTHDISVDPLLGPLQDNGGPTWTYALLDGSPVIDAGDVSQCPTTDQRGFYRPIDGDGDGIAVCDIGAYEYGSPGPLGNLIYLPIFLRH